MLIYQQKISSVFVFSGCGATKMSVCSYCLAVSVTAPNANRLILELTIIITCINALDLCITYVLRITQLLGDKLPPPACFSCVSINSSASILSALIAAT